MWIISTTAASTGCALGDRAAGPPRQEDQRRPQPLAVIVGAVIDELLHEREPASQLVLEDPLGLGELGAIGRNRSVSVRRAFSTSSAGRLAIPDPPSDSTFNRSRANAPGSRSTAFPGCHEPPGSSAAFAAAKMPPPSARFFFELDLADHHVRSTDLHMS